MVRFISDHISLKVFLLFPVKITEAYRLVFLIMFSDKLKAISMKMKVRKILKKSPTTCNLMI